MFALGRNGIVHHRRNGAFEHWRFGRATIFCIIKSALNGVTIIDQDLKEIDQSKLGKRPDGFDRASGFIGFAGHSDPVQMRNVRIKKH